MRELRCTYRLQLGPGLDFARARELVPYLERLGVSHLYLSPSLQARRGSTHGYDVVDPTRMSEELGGEEEFAGLAAAGLGIVLDIVPNHMGVSEENRWWSDPELRARFFDLDPAGEGYRRFFDIDDLAALRQEDPEVFETTHRRVLDLVGDGLVDGLRVDHPDGLADPAGYLGRLRAEGVDRVWVEKILDPDEELRDWPVSGTVGYEFCNDVCALFVDPAGREPLGRLLAEFTGESRGFGEIALEAQLEQAEGTFAREVARLERLVPGRFGAGTLREGLAGLPIYRTYVEPWSGRVEAADREAVGRSGMAEDLAAALLLEDRNGIPEEFVTRFQQTSPPVTAKGVEDTAFYRYLRLLALNEVGGDPDRFGLSVGDFHARQAERGRRFPEGLLVTQTHDTKRSGDARARIGALAGMAGAWGAAVGRWRQLNARLRDGPAPDGSEEYLIYQTLAGVWPISGDRLEEYLEKALREAKRNTNWVDRDEAWEAGVKGFAGRVIGHEPFLADFEAFLGGVVAEGERSALGQLLLKLTSPGVPDIYQGDELWALSLVDPDNRRAVDWARRRDLLEEVLGGAPPRAETRKLGLIVRVLDLRRRRAETFARGAYTPVEAGDEVCAFLRGEDVLVVVRVRAGAGAGAPSAGPGGPSAGPGAASAGAGAGAGAEIEAGTVEVPAGTWRDVLGAGVAAGGDKDAEAAGGELDGGGAVALESLVGGPWPGLGLYERV